METKHLTALLESQMRSVYGYCLRRCGDAQDAQDVAQEILLRAHAALLSKKADRSVLAAMLLSAGGWTGDTVPYSMSLRLDPVTPDCLVELIPGGSITAKELTALQNANIQGGQQRIGRIDLLAYGEKPEIDLPVRLVIRGDL